ncbi:hypothetical protein BGX29_008187 [Mortierella sp. GBA35]|nr:hypothetical protein BGX29_008187 [Mortierella sp. GBA35]
MDLTLAEETTATTTTFSYASPQPTTDTTTIPGTTMTAPGSTTMDFFFHGALDQLQGATELDVQLNPLLMNRVTQLCLAKISIASSGRESLRRVAQLSCFWRRLQSDMFFMSLQSAPQTTTSLDPNNMFATPTTEPFATWNWLQDTTGLELDYFNLGNEAAMTAAGNTGYTTLLSDPSDLSDSSSAPSTVPSSSSLSSIQPLSSSTSGFPITSASANTTTTTSNTSVAITGSIMAYPDLPGCNSSNNNGIQTCQPIVSSPALSVSDVLAYQMAFQSVTSNSSPTGDIQSNSNSNGNNVSTTLSSLSSPPFAVSVATLAHSSPCHDHKASTFSMLDDVSAQNEMGSPPEKTEMDIDKSPHANTGKHLHQTDGNGDLFTHHPLTPMAADSDSDSDDHDDREVTDMDVDRAIQEMALHSAPSSPSKRHPYDTRHQHQLQRSAHSTSASSKSEDPEVEFSSASSSSTLPLSFTARLVSVLQDEDLEMEEEELELHRIKRRRCSQDSSSSDSGPESAPTSPRTPPSSLEGSQEGVAPLHSASTHAGAPGLSARRLYNLHPEGDGHDASSSGSSANPFLASPMADYALQDSGMMRKEHHHRLIASAAANSSISTANGPATTTVTATSGGGGMVDGVAGAAGSVAVVVVEDLLNLNRQGEGEGQVGILATTVHTRYPTRSTTQRRVD